MTTRMSVKLPAQSRGFSLIEIMIVVVIIALMSAAVALSVGDSNKQTPLAKEAELLRSEFRFAAEQSVLNGEILALIVEQKNTSAKDEIDASTQWCYRWVRKLPAADIYKSPWIKLPPSTLDDHCMPEFIEWELVVEGHKWVYDPHLERQDPVLVFAPSGESTPIEMALFESNVQLTGKEKIIEKIAVDSLSNVTPLDTEDEEQNLAEQNAQQKSTTQKK